jgi:hypothetical protein
VGDVVDVTLEDGKITALVPCKEEAQRREDKNRSRLEALFAKGRKPK